MLEFGSRQNMTDMDTKRARGKCIAYALVCQLCWTFLLSFNSNFSETDTEILHNTSDRRMNLTHFTGVRVIGFIDEAFVFGPPFLGEWAPTFWPSFYQRVSIACYANRWYSQRRHVRPSVRPSVRLSHSGIVSKRRKLASWFLHRPRAWTF